MNLGNAVLLHTKKASPFTLSCSHPLQHCSIFSANTAPPLSPSAPQITSFLTATLSLIGAEVLVCASDISPGPTGRTPHPLPGCIQQLSAQPAGVSAKFSDYAQQSCVRAHIKAGTLAMCQALAVRKPVLSYNVKWAL